MALEFFLDCERDPPVAKLTGGLTLGPQLTRFSKAVLELLHSRCLSGLILDVGGIREIDSAGLGELVILYTASSEGGSHLCLVGPNQRVLRLLEMTRLEGLLPHFADEPSALDWLRGRVIE